MATFQVYSLHTHTHKVYGTITYFFLKKKKVAAGPIGRNAEASGTASLKSVSAVYSYSKTRGLFAGVSLEGSVIVERFDANKKMYGGKVKPRDLLNGTIPPPESAQELYRALELKTHSSGGGIGRFRYTDDVDDASVNSESTGNVSRSFSRAAVRSMAKGGSVGNNPTTSNYADSSSNGMDRFHSSDFDPPRQITNTESRAVVRNEPEELQARALFNFTGEQDGDLVFHKGDIIFIIQKTDTQNDWWTGKLNNRQGIVKFFFFYAVYFCKV